MKTNLRIRRNIWPAVLIIVLVVAFSAALLREGRLRDLDVARLGSLEAANFISEDLAENISVRELPKQVTGWGLYSPEGGLIRRWGSAPEQLVTERSPQLVTEIADGTILRTIRTVMPAGPLPGGSSQSRGKGMGMRRRILIDWDLHAAGNPAVWRIIGVSGFTLLAVALLAMQQLSARRIADYRSKEADQRRLIQLGMAARTLTHEIRNPLGILKAQQALLNKTLPSDQSESLKIIGEEVDRLNALTDRVREWLADPAGNPVVFNAAAVLADIFKRQDWSVLTDFTSRESKIRMDPALFTSAIVNLVQNAMESGEFADGDGIPEVGLEDHGKSLQISIKDRGKGLPPGDEDRIFDPFFTTKIKGSGVGLALARQFIEAAGGSLKLSNRRSGGVQALITLPLEKE